MKFFADTADIDEIRELAQAGLLDGVTTNPTLVSRTGRALHDVVEDILNVVDGPISVEVAATEFEPMLEEGRTIAKVSPKIAVKVPLTPAGLKTCKILRQEGQMVNVTLCFSPAQALLAAKAGATFVSPFVGRLDDVATRGMDLIEDIVTIFDNYPTLETEVLVASVRSVEHVVEAALVGAHVVTCPSKVIWQMFKHPLTDSGIAAFIADWEKTGQSIADQL